MAKEYGRGRLWVDPGFQLRLLARAAAYMVLYTFVIVHVGFLFELMWEAYYNGMPGWAFYFAFLAKHQFFFLGAVLLLPSMLYDLLKFSHRVAGPLFRCRAVMTKMAQGETVPEFKPRENDLMGDLFLAFNNLIKQWNVRLAAQEPTQDDGPGTSAVATKPEVVESVR